MRMIMESKRIIVKKEQLYEGNLILVNQKNSVRKKQENNNLSIALPTDQTVLLQKEASVQLKKAIKECQTEEKIVPVSGYRSKEEQIKIYEDSLQENGIEFTKKYVANPDESEHQTGLAIDLGLKQDQIDFICPDFPNLGICKEFRKIALKYGFVERYPKGKEEITGIAHEPWHFRYVGYPHAHVMQAHGFTLEEYIDYLKNLEAQPLLVHYKETTLSIYYKKLVGEEMEIGIPNGKMYLISGDNREGFIITIFQEREWQGERKNREGA